MCDFSSQVTVPEELLTDEKFNAFDLKVYHGLMAFQIVPGFVITKYEFLAEYLNLPRTTILRSIRVLDKNGITRKFHVEDEKGVFLRLPMQVTVTSLQDLQVPVYELCCEKIFVSVEEINKLLAPYARVGACAQLKNIIILNKFPSLSQSNTSYYYSFVQGIITRISNPGCVSSENEDEQSSDNTCSNTSRVKRKIKRKNNTTDETLATNRERPGETKTKTKETTKTNGNNLVRKKFRRNRKSKTKETISLQKNSLPKKQVPTRKTEQVFNDFLRRPFAVQHKKSPSSKTYRRGTELIKRLLKGTLMPELAGKMEPADIAILFDRFEKVAFDDSVKPRPGPYKDRLKKISIIDLIYNPNTNLVSPLLKFCLTEPKNVVEENILDKNLFNLVKKEYERVLGLNGNTRYSVGDMRALADISNGIINFIQEQRITKPAKKVANILFEEVERQKKAGKQINLHFLKQNSTFHSLLPHLLEKNDRLEPEPTESVKSLRRKLGLN